MKTIKEFLWAVCDAIPTALTILIVELLVVAFYKQGPTLAGLLSILNVVLWPIVVLAALLFFRRVLTFMFFSLNEFNFFGARGKLKSVEGMIKEKAKELWEAEKQEEEREREKKVLLAELESLQDSKQGQAKNAIKTLKFAEKLIDDNTKLRKQMTAMRTEIDSLQAQNVLLQGNIPDGSSSVVSAILGQAEEERDVGSVNPTAADPKATKESKAT